jgi:hypothetical protein
MGAVRIMIETMTGGAFHLEIDCQELVGVVKETLCQIQGRSPCTLSHIKALCVCGYVISRRVS